MWKKLKYLYQNSSDQRKLALKDKLHKIKCEKGETISTYLNKLTTCRDELGSVGITTADDDMEEIRRSTRDGSSLKQDDEENLALMMGHYATNCPQKKSKKGSSKGSDGEALASQFELNFSLIACMVSSMVGCVWYLDSGASFHMSGDKNLFSTLEEKDLQMRIEMGDDGKYRVSSEATVVFQREHGAPLTLTDVKYVPSLKKNLVFVAMLEDKGYDVVFSKGNVFLRHIVYYDVTKDARKKLDPTAELGILVGYTDTPHNYGVYLPTTQRTLVHRVLTFDEQKSMHLSLERELELHAEEELSIPKEEEPQIDVEQPHAEDPKWRHPLMMRLPKMDKNTQGKLTV
eukprot:PITA_09733